MTGVQTCALPISQKSSDMFMKCQYMDELTGGKGTVFATGTPVSNSMGTDARGNLTRLDNALAGIPGRLERGREQLENLRNQQAAAQVELTKPFPQEAELAEKSARLAELDAALSMEDSIDRDGGEVSEEVGDGERPSVLEDLKKRAAEIPPDKKPGKELERG